MLDTCVFSIADFRLLEGFSDVAFCKRHTMRTTWHLDRAGRRRNTNLRVCIVDYYNSAKQQQDRYLSIEASLPKFLHGNSVQELVDTDRDALVARIQEQLQKLYGIEVSVSSILTAKIRRVDFVRNIALSAPSVELFERLRLCTMKPGAEFTNTHYGVKREGIQVRWFSRQRTLSIYDKGIESGIANLMPGTTVARIELRLIGNAVWREVRKWLVIGIPTLTDVFNTDLSNKILFHQLSSVPCLAQLLGNPIGTMPALPKNCSKKYHYFLENFFRCANQHGTERAIKELREAVSKDTFYRIKKLIEQCTPSDPASADPWSIISNALKPPNV